MEGPYQIFRRAVAYATSAGVSVPANGAFHAYVKYSEAMNDYAVLTLSVSTDDFATSTDLWNSTKESGHTGNIWHQVEADLSAFAGKSVKFRFTTAQASPTSLRRADTWPTTPSTAWK